MKNSFKKIISLVLTVLMLVGTVTMLVPITASAEDNYTTITPNTDFVHNGVTYRFDVQSGNTESYARILADGSVEFKLADGDIMWFPGVEATDSSEIHAEVTAVDRITKNNDGGMANLFAGLVYGYNADSETGVGAIIKTNKNYRVTNLTRSNLAGHNGSDGYGSGGDKPRIKDGTASSQAGVYTSNANCWKFGTTITFDISKLGNDVNVKLSGTEVFADYSYPASSGYSFAGAIGFAPVWSATAENRYSTFRFDALTLTNCTVEGEAKATYTVLDRAEGTEPDPEPELPEAPEGTVYLEKNKTATYKGITYRFDTNKENDANSWVRVNADGSWEINIRNGDMLWFPDVGLTDTSEVYLEVTKTGNNTSDYFPGLAYGVTSSTDSTWTSTNVAVLRTWQNNNMRFRATAATRADLIKVSGSDYGNGGGSTRPFNNEFAATELWNSIAHIENHNWNIGKTVYQKVSQTGDKVVLEYGVPGQGAFVDPTNTSYANNYAGMYAVAGGSVGYTMVWQANDTAHSQFRIEDIIITNCKVGGVDKASYSVKAVETGVENVQMSLSLNGTIGLNFAFNASNLANATVVATKNGVEIVNQPVVNGENIVTVPVNAKEMTDAVNISIMQDGEVFDGNTYTATVKEYAEKLMADENYNDWDELMSAMLNYGAAAQMALNYKTDALAVENFNGVDYDFSGYEAISFTGSRDILAGLFMNLDLEADTAFNVYFKPANGVELTVTVNGEAATLTDNGDGYYVLTIGGIAADKLVEDFAIVVNGEFSFAVNALDWAKIASADSETETLANALAAYADAAARKN